RLLDRGSYGVGRLLVDVGDENLGAACGEHPADRCADPRAAAGDQPNLAAEVVGHHLAPASLCDRDWEKKPPHQRLERKPLCTLTWINTRIPDEKRHRPSLSALATAWAVPGVSCFFIHSRLAFCASRGD